MVSYGNYRQTLRVVSIVSVILDRYFPFETAALSCANRTIVIVFDKEALKLGEKDGGNRMFVGRKNRNRSLLTT